MAAFAAVYWAVSYLGQLLGWHTPAVIRLMGFVRKCPKCGQEIMDAASPVCPMCGTTFPLALKTASWQIVLVQIVLSAIFMAVFGFPKIMIAIFTALILIGNIFSLGVKRTTASARPVVQKPARYPVLFRIVSLGMAVCAFGFIASLLFGFVIFMNSWTDWHRYEGQPYHEADFQVTRAYYQKHNRGGDDVFASGLVDGQREWMNLRPYLHTMPRSQAELDARVPAGTSIDIYLFPNLKGRARVRVVKEVPPAEAYRRSATAAVGYGLFGLALTGGLMFLLSRVRRLCFIEEEGTLSVNNPQLQIGQSR